MLFVQNTTILKNGICNIIYNKMFNYILFDLDNTIYNYDKSHELSLKKVITEISKEFNIPENDLNNNYVLEKKKLQNYCKNASSHNKFIQIKRLFEKFKLNLERLNYYHDLYNKNFIENLVLYPFLLDFLKYCKSKGIKMYILTNNISADQITRLNSKGVINYFEKVYTSEEFGIEKPDMKLYYYVIQDIGCNKNEIVKIGDNYKNDIEPMIINNLYAFWFNNNDFNIKDQYLEFNNYNDLNLFFEKYYNSLTDYLEISNYVGERFDLVQAGGGNTSFKTENLMFVKSSGSCLSNLDINKNYVGLNYSNIKNKINDKFFMKDGCSNNKFNLVTDLNKKEREIECKKIVDSNIVFLKNFKPSIETSLHCYTHKLCVHIHPIQFNYISSLPNCDDIINSIFDNFIIIDYVTPGIDVTLELVKKYNGEKIIFMKNHGLVITSDSVIELKNILDNTIEKLETYSNLNFNLYKIVNKISKEMNMITNEKTITYMSENIFINNYINSNSLDNIFRPYFPDKVVYCGTSYLIFTLDTISQDIKEYINNYDEIPKVFILRNEEKYLLYINSKSINKCKEIEEVLLSHFICYNELNIFLDKSEINYLNNWDAEKFRKNLQ